MELFEAIQKRQSYRGSFKQQAVSRDDLHRIVQAGLMAPSGKNAQTTEFVIIDEAAAVAVVRKMHTSSKAMQEAAAYIVCIVDKQAAAVYEGFSFAVEDCAAAVENMLLAITALGYASVWVDGWLRLEGRAAVMGKLIGLPAEKAVRIILPVGAPAESYPQPAKKPFNARAWFNRYHKND